MGGCAVCIWPELLVLVCSSAISGAWSALVWWCTSVATRLKIMPSVCTENCKEDSGNRLHRGDDLWPSTGLFEELLISWCFEHACKHTHTQKHCQVPILQMQSWQAHMGKKSRHPPMSKAHLGLVLRIRKLPNCTETYATKSVTIRSQWQQLNRWRSPTVGH